MKKLLKNSIFTFILGAIIFGGIGVLASTILASNISYNNTTVEGALNELYIKANLKPNITVLAALTDNYIQPSSKQYSTTITKNGKLIVDMGAVDGNNKLETNWTYFVKKNNVSINSAGGYVNGYNGHYYWIFEVTAGDSIETSTTVSYNNNNYNAVTLSVYFID